MNLRDRKLFLKGTNAWLIYTLLNVVIPCGLSATDQLVTNSLNNSPMEYLEALVGDQILLPCDISPPITSASAHDAPILVLFYREEKKTPIYSLDSRGSNIASGIHWTASNLERRAYMKTLPQVQGLLLEDLILNDAGLYRCRVDFKASPTRNSKVELKVIDPPKRITITSSWEGDRMTKEVIGPYPEGAQITLSCQVVGGAPPPLVTWWHGGSLLDDQSEVRSGGVTRNSLYLPKLTRLDLLKVLTCQALNSNLTSPLLKTVTIDLAYPPSAIHISSSSNQWEIEGQVKIPNRVTCLEEEECPLECKVDGSRPPPLVTWKTSDRTLESEFKTISSPPGVKSKSRPGSDNSSFYSTLMLTANASDNGALISCRASSPALRNQAVEDSIELNVLYKPRLRLTVKNRIDLSNVEEGEDIQFQCSVKANPTVYEIQWTHKWIPLAENSGAGILISSSGSELILKKVRSSMGGQIACAAANTRGSGTSNAIELRVKFAPKCSSEQRRSVGIGKFETSNVTCRVNAHPPATIFRWAFNASHELIDIPFDQQIEKNDSSNTIRYSPRRPFGYGDLLCWASNAVGTMKSPCVIRIIPIDKPEGVRNCKIYPNGTEPDGRVSVIISCHFGWDGGLTQTFTLEVRESITEKLVSVVPELKPVFQFRHLKPGGHFLFTVTAANSRGTSPPVTLKYNAPEAVIAGLTNKHSKPKNQFLKYLPLLALFGALVVVFTTCASIIACIAKSRAAEKANRAKEMQKGSTIEIRKTSTLPSSSPDKFDDLDDEGALKTPDRYCAIHGHERQENEYISYKHYFNNMRDNFETQHLLKSSTGGSIGMDNNYSAFCSSSPRGSSCSYNCLDHRKDSLSEYALKVMQQRYSDGSFKGLAPLASVDSLSGFSTGSNQSSKRAETVSQKSFPAIPEIISTTSSGEDENHPTKLPSMTSARRLATLKDCNSFRRSPQSLSQLPYLYTNSDPKNPLFSTYNSTSYISQPSSSTYTRPFVPSTPDPSTPDPGTEPSLGHKSGHVNLDPESKSFNQMDVPTLPPPMMNNHPLYSGYNSGRRGRVSPDEDSMKCSWYSTSDSRKSSRESSV